MILRCNSWLYTKESLFAVFGEPCGTQKKKLTICKAYTCYTISLAPISFFKETESQGDSGMGPETAQLKISSQNLFFYFGGTLDGVCRLFLAKCSGDNMILEIERSLLLVKHLLCPWDFLPVAQVSFEWCPLN